MQRAIRTALLTAIRNLGLYYYNHIFLVFLSNFIVVIHYLALIDEAVGKKGPTFIDSLQVKSARREKFDKRSVIIANYLEMGTILIIYPYKVILT